VLLLLLHAAAPAAAPAWGAIYMDGCPVVAVLMICNRAAWQKAAAGGKAVKGQLSIGSHKRRFEHDCCRRQHAACIVHDGACKACYAHPAGRSTTYRSQRQQTGRSPASRDPQGSWSSSSAVKERFGPVSALVSRRNAPDALGWAHHCKLT